MLINYSKLKLVNFTGNPQLMEKVFVVPNHMWINSYTTLKKDVG